jgi:hypothetical protein
MLAAKSVESAKTQTNGIERKTDQMATPIKSAIVSD